MGLFWATIVSINGKRRFPKDFWKPIKEER